MKRKKGKCAWRTKSKTTFKLHVFCFVNYIERITYTVRRATAVAEFIDPYGGYKVNSGIGLSYRPARLHGLAGLYDNPAGLPETTLSPGIYEFGYWMGKGSVSGTSGIPLIPNHRVIEGWIILVRTQQIAYSHSNLRRTVLCTVQTEKKYFKVKNVLSSTKAKINNFYWKIEADQNNISDGLCWPFCFFYFFDDLNVKCGEKIKFLANGKNTRLQ